MNPWQSTILVLAVMALSLTGLRIRPGYRAWHRNDKISYLILVAALWPWIIVSVFTSPPRWYTALALGAAAAACAWYLTMLIRFLRTSRAELDRYAAAEAEAEAAYRQSLNPPAERPEP